MRSNHTTPHLFIYLLCLLIGGTLDTTLYSQNTVKGVVEFAEINKKIKITRGSNYRQRGESTEEDKSEENTTETKAIHSVVSLTPVDMQVKLSPRDAYLKQIDKTFVPHVVAVQKGSSVVFTNEDDFYHNVFSLSKGNRFNIGRKKPKVDVKKSFKNTGLVKVFCDIHPHMSAYILCLDTPYFTKVNENGHYEIKGLPDGKYKMEFFNPSVEVKDEIIELANGIVMEKNYKITPDNSSAYIEYDRRWYAGCCTGQMCSATAGE